MIFYCLVPIADLTQAMINRSSSSCCSTMPQITIDSVVYYIVEFVQTTANTYDLYRWYSDIEIRSLIEANQ